MSDKIMLPAADLAAFGETGGTTAAAPQAAAAGEQSGGAESPASAGRDDPGAPKKQTTGRTGPDPDGGPGGPALQAGSPACAPQAETPALPDPAAAAFAAAADRHARASAFAAARCRGWLAEAEALSADEPDFDLAAAGRSRICRALLRAGLPLRDAWRAANVDAVARRAAEGARAAVCADIRARGARPTEAGAAATPAFGSREDVTKLSDAEVRRVLDRVERREHVSFG